MAHNNSGDRYSSRCQASNILNSSIKQRKLGNEEQFITGHNTDTIVDVMVLMENLILRVFLSACVHTKVISTIEQSMIDRHANRLLAR